MAKKHKLRSGFTTGTAAAAAAKGALTFLLAARAPARVKIKLLTGDEITIPVHRCRHVSKTEAVCTVIKDAGDDPDVTHKAEIGVKIKLGKDANLEYGEKQLQGSVYITGGDGVGRVTKPGLEVPPGEPAINPGPRKMITQAILEVLSTNGCEQPVAVEVFVPQGKKLAEKTLNARLGILGGLSILGTTGIVRPMSHEAFTATIKSALSVARASGLNRVVLTTGRRSERFSQTYWSQLPEEGFIQIGDFFKMSLEHASGLSFKNISLAVFFGKAIKMAQGIPHTHAANSSLTLGTLSQWCWKLTRDRQFAEVVKSANTARHAFEMISNQYPQVIRYVGKQIIQGAKLFSTPNINMQSVIFEYNGEVVFDSARQ